MNYDYLIPEVARTISPEMSAEVEQLRQQQMMMGMDPTPEAQAGSSTMDYLSSLWFGSGGQMGHDVAPDLAEKYGVSRDAFNTAMGDIDQRTAKKAPGLIRAVGKVGNFVKENPAVLLAAPLALGAMGGAFGGGAAASGGGSGGMLAADAAPAAGYSGLSTIPGAADMTVLGAAPAAGGGAAAATAAAAAPALINQGVQGPPQPTQPTINQGAQGPPAPTGASNGMLSGASSFLRNNKDLVGAVLAGVGNSMAARDQADAESDLLHERNDITAGNYRGASPGSKYRGMLADTQTQTPTERFSPEKYGSWQYEWNARLGKMVRVPVDHP